MRGNNGAVLTVLVFTFLTLILLPTIANSQVVQSPDITQEQQITLPDPLTPETIRELVSRLSDQEVRDLLLKRLDAVVQNNDQTTSNQTLLEFLFAASNANAQSVLTAISRAPILWEFQIKSFSNFFSKLGASGVLKLFSTILISIMVGLAAEWVINRIVQSRLSSRVNANAADDREFTLGETLRFLIIRLINDIAGLIVFLAITRSIMSYFLPEELRAYGHGIMLYLVVLPRAFASLSPKLVGKKGPC